MSNQTENSRIPAFVPEQFESERLILRCARPEEDAAMVNDAVDVSLEELRPWMPWANLPPCTLEEQIEVLQSSRQKYTERTDFRLLLFSKETGEMVGSSGIHRMDWEVGKFEIGYWVVTQHSGKGYITEAVDRITKFCIEEFQANRIEIRCDALNVKSAAVAERLGFKLEGIQRKDSLDTSGNLSDTMIFSKVRGEEF